jgi:hypothetical protein
MEDFHDFRPNCLSPAQAYSHVKGMRMAAELTTVAHELATAKGEDTSFRAVARRAYYLAKNSRAQEWRATAKRADMPNAPSATSMRVCLVTLALMAGVTPTPMPEEVAV